MDCHLILAEWGLKKRRQVIRYLVNVGKVISGFDIKECMLYAEFRFYRHPISSKLILQRYPSSREPKASKKPLSAFVLFQKGKINLQRKYNPPQSYTKCGIETASWSLEAVRSRPRLLYRYKRHDRLDGSRLYSS